MEPLSNFITEKELPHGGRVFVAPMKTPDVVTIEGSVLGGWNYLPRGRDEAPVLAAELLDAGTKGKKKEVLRGRIADRGASLAFTPGGDRTCFSATCLPEDVSFMLSLIAECLEGSVFPAAELIVARQRELSRIKEKANDTRIQANFELTRLLYDKTHVLYMDPDEARERTLARTNRADLTSFQKRLGQGGLVLAITGDVDERAAAGARRAFAPLRTGTTIRPTKPANTKIRRKQERRIVIPGKANIDIYLGASLPLRFGDPAYFPMTLLANMLGGGFAGHLMQTVRDRDGLTYGIRSTLCGFEPDTDGYFSVWSTFSPELLEQGLEATMREMKVFLTKGLVEDALVKSKDELTGMYAIQLSTTGGMAHTLHAIGVRDLPLSRIDDYPTILRNVSLRQVREAASLIPLNDLSLAAAGTFKRK